MRYFFLFILLPCFLPAQPDSIYLQPPDANQELLEDFLQNTESEGVFDYNTLFEYLENYRDHPLNLNMADEDNLRELGLLTDIQILDFLQYRKEAGKLIAIHELQAIPSFDLLTIKRMLPYVTITARLEDYHIPLLQMFTEGKNEIYLRWQRILERQKGYLPLQAGERGSRYFGDPNKLYIRYKHTHSNKLSYGLTAEKDRGEEFFKGSNSQGFDFYSAHLYLRNYHQTIKAIAVGDYSISLGQGLILFSGFSYGKSSQVMNIKRSGRVIRPYTSVNEVDFMRGAATTLGLGKKFELTAFVSSMKRDGNLVDIDTTELEVSVRNITSLDTDGLHRSKNEIEDEKVVRQFTTGASLKFKRQSWHIAANALYNRFDRSLERRLRPYNQFSFNGKQLVNFSADYSFVFQNFNFFGETALSGNGAIATLNGLLIGLDRKVDLAILYRHYPRDYQALNTDPFAETSGGKNESGLYLGLEVRPVKNWIFNAYFDNWQHPWLRFNTDGPSRGYEYRARITHFKKRKYRVYIEFREEIKQANAPDNDSKLNFGITTRLFQTRLHFSNQLTKAVELRSRIDFGLFDNEVEPKLHGFMILQDVLFRPIGFPLSFTARYALFDTGGFGIRFYNYENSLLYNFSIPAYYNKGSRFYLNLRYKPILKLTIEARFAQTYWSNQKTIGSSLEEIDGPVRSELAAQIKYRF